MIHKELVGYKIKPVKNYCTFEIINTSNYEIKFKHTKYESIITLLFRPLYMGTNYEFFSSL